MSEVLQSGQRIRIITAPGAQPNPSWLNFVLTAKARSAIRHFLKTQQHDESVDLGKRLLDRALNNFGSSYHDIKKSQIKHLLKETEADTFESVLQQIGLGNRVAYAVANVLMPEKKRNKSTPNLDSPILVDNADGMITSFARCCHPIPGDLILGHISPGRGLVVHRHTCKNLNEIKSSTEKCMPLSWSPTVHGEFPVELKLGVCSDRGIVATLAARITEQDATIDQIKIKEQDTHSSSINLIIGVKDRIHLANIMRRIRGLKSVQAVYRQKN